jgi:hypothetical protein
MKKIILTTALAILMMHFMKMTGNAQSTGLRMDIISNIKSPEFPDAFNPVFDKQTEAEIEMNSSLAARKMFSRFFKNETVSYWHKMSDGYEAYFTSADIKNKAIFNNKGSLTYLLKFYGQNKLSTEIKRAVEEKYAGYTIFNIEEINIMADNTVMYVIYLDNTISRKSILYVEGELIVVGEVKK